MDCFYRTLDIVFQLPFMPTQMLVLIYSSYVVLELFWNSLSLPHRFLDGNRITVLHHNVFRSLGHLQKLLVKTSDLC